MWNQCTCFASATIARYVAITKYCELKGLFRGARHRDARSSSSRSELTCQDQQMALRKLMHVEKLR